MNGNRIWMIGTALAIVGVLALGWLLGVSPKLSEADLADEQRLSVELQNATQEAALLKLRDQFDRLPELEEELAALRKELPESHEIDSFIDSIWDATVQSGAVFTTVEAAEAMPMATVEATETAATDGSGSFTIQMTISVGGSFEQVVAFSRLMQEGRRTFFAPTFTSDDSGATLTGYLFVVRGPHSPPLDAETTTDDPDAPTEDAAP
jgi:Tfp pilus assembly protein PilO